MSIPLFTIAAYCPRGVHSLTSTYRLRNHASPNQQVLGVLSTVDVGIGPEPGPGGYGSQRGEGIATKKKKASLKIVASLIGTATHDVPPSCCDSRRYLDGHSYGTFNMRVFTRSLAIRLTLVSVRGSNPKACVGICGWEGVLRWVSLCGLARCDAQPVGPEPCGPVWHCHHLGVEMRQQPG